MRVFIIRHGETTGDVESRYGGWYDDDLSPKGIEQSRMLANHLRGRSIEVIFHSPLKRAEQTARILSKVLHIPLVVEPDIKERNNYGILTGLTKEEAHARFPDEVTKLQGYDHAVKGSEPYSSFKRRILRGFSKINSKSYKSIALVTHGGPIYCLVREVLKLGEFRRLGDCAYLEIEINLPRVKLLRMHNAELSDAKS